MTLSMYQASAPVFLQMLRALQDVLDKAEAHATAGKIDPAVLLGWRLAPTMFALTRQVQVASDTVKGALSRLAGQEAPKWEDNEASFADLRARIARTIAYAESFTPAQIDGSETRTFSIPLGGQPTEFQGQPYLLQFALPNFYFHVTAAYAILRACGVPLGKRDYLGKFR